MFTWKFFEKFLIRPRDDKADNIAVTEFDAKYFFTSLDNDVTLGHKIYSVVQPNTYTVLYLSNLMQRSIHAAAIQMVLHMDLKKIFTEWIDEFRRNNKFLFGTECLFDSKELTRIQSLQGKTFEGKCRSCYLDLCFTNADLIGVFNRLLNLKATLKTRESHDLKIDDTLTLGLVKPMTHFDLLALLEREDFEHYKRAFDADSNLNMRFSKLPGFEKHFKSSGENSAMQIMSTRSVSTPTGLVHVIKEVAGLEKAAKIKPIQSLSRQVEIMRFYTGQRVIDNQDLGNVSSFLSDLSSNSMSDISLKEMITLFGSSDVDMRQISFVDLSWLKDAQCVAVFRQQKSLQKLTIKSCPNVSDAIFAYFLRRNNYKCSIKTVLLAQLPLLRTIQTRELSIQILYLFNLSDLVTLEVQSDGSNLSKCYIDKCPQLKKVNVNLFKLRLLLLKGFDFTALNVTYNMRSREVRDDSSDVGDSTEREDLFRNDADKKRGEFWRVKRTMISMGENCKKIEFKIIKEDTNFSGLWRYAVKKEDYDKIISICYVKICYCLC